MTSASVDATTPRRRADDVRNVIIIGSGPAGYTAALYAARAQLNPLVFEGSVTAGGALMTTTEVENYPGFRDGIMGPALMDDMRAQAERFGAELVPDDVTGVDLTGDDQDRPHRRRHASTARRPSILAMGSGYRKLGLPDEDRLSGHGVSWCATCDGFFFRDKDIVVVGGGDSAVEEATFLTQFGRTVTIVVRRDELRASKIMQQRALADPKISIAWNSEVEPDPRRRQATGLTLRDTVTGETRELEASGLFIAIGHDPRSELVKGQVDLDADGYVLVDAPSTCTNLNGVFARGDLVDHRYRQAVTAAGTGCAAAIDAERWLADAGRPPSSAATYPHGGRGARRPRHGRASSSPYDTRGLSPSSTRYPSPRNTEEHHRGQPSRP